MRTQLLAVTASVAASLALASSASAATFHTAPNATRTTAPCTQAQPCKLTTALDLAFDGDDVPLASGTYTHAGSDPLEIRPGVEVHGTPGSVRPLIEQAAPYRDCAGCAVLNIAGDGTLRDVDVAQVEGGGAVRLASEGVVERSSLRGRSFAVTFTTGPAGRPAGGLIDVLAVADEGTAIVARHGGNSARYLENVTAVGRGALGVGIRAESSAGVDETIDAVNTIARGDHMDVQSIATGSAGINDVATVKLRYSTYRADRLEGRESDPAWPNARFETHDNNRPGDPLFASATDFRVKEGSPAIDNGRAAALIGTLDLDGNGRIFGAKPDIGAYEWRPAPPQEQPKDEDPTAPAGDQQQGPGPQQGSGDQQPRTPVQPEIPKQPEQPLAGLGIRRQTVSVKKNVAAVRVECPASATAGCSGRLVLRSGKARVGSATYKLKAGKRGVVKVKLTRAARKLIARKRKLKVTATAPDATAAITLKIVRRRR